MRRDIAMLDFLHKRMFGDTHGDICSLLPLFLEPKARRCTRFRSDRPSRLFQETFNGTHPALMNGGPGGNLNGNAPATCCRGSSQCPADLPCRRTCSELRTDCDEELRRTKKVPQQKVRARRGKPMPMHALSARALSGDLCAAGADQNRLLRRPVPSSVAHNLGREADMPYHR